MISGNNDIKHYHYNNNDINHYHYNNNDIKQLISLMI